LKDFYKDFFEYFKMAISMKKDVLHPDGFPGENAQIWNMCDISSDVPGKPAATNHSAA
jgi:hypothetical protein